MYPFMVLDLAAVDGRAVVLDLAAVEGWAVVLVLVLVLVLVPLIPFALPSSPALLDLLKEVSLLNSAMALDTTAVQAFPIRREVDEARKDG
jgi:hypothetical protein